MQMPIETPSLDKLMGEVRMLKYQNNQLLKETRDYRYKLSSMFMHYYLTNASISPFDEKGTLTDYALDIYLKIETSLRRAEPEFISWTRTPGVMFLSRHETGMFYDMKTLAELEDFFDRHDIKGMQTLIVNNPKTLEDYENIERLTLEDAHFKIEHRN